MTKNLKSKTLYADNKNVDISGLVNQMGGTANKGSKDNKNIKGTKNTKGAKNKKYDSESDDESVNDSEYGESENENEEDESDISDSESEEDEINNNNINNEDKDEDGSEDDENNEDDNTEKSEDENSDIDDKEEKDYIDNEETLKSKCYSKYARVDYDELDFDELFGEETLNPDKNIKLTKPVLTKYEFVRLLTDRSKQLAQGAKPMLKNIDGLSSKEIAKLELKNKIIPLIIERPVPNSNVERWKLSELEIPEHLFTN